jgi:hypothetical protein
MILRKHILTAVFLVLLWGIGCGENRAIIVRTSDSSKTLIQILMQPDPDSKMGNIGQEHPDLRQTIARAINPFLSQQETRDTAEKALARIHSGPG